MIRIACTAVLAVSALAFAAPAEATLFSFSAILSPLNEVPPTVSNGSGTISVVADDVAGSFTVNESWANLTGPVTGAHIHCCAAAGATAPVVVPFTNFPPTASGTYSGTFTPATFAAILSGMQAGQAYANIHTRENPNGEIRGQLAPVPEPASWATLLLGLGAVGTAMRRRGRPAIA